jgi:hypothetical protein
MKAPHCLETRTLDGEVLQLLICQPVRFDEGFAVHPEVAKGRADEDKC